MGKKGKIGKARKDKFYQLAKETGYRARSAFKLIQLNRKFSFLQNARVCIDLCAAPGGWCQVAAKFMPISSLIIGVDLVPIKPISGVITVTDDITSDSCRASLRKEIQTWKADIVLNDGAPNVGQAWTQDAFSQAHLTLQAFKLAAEFLREGGTFVTKIFRSKDYHPILWVLQQFFKKVNVTKPQASRNESAEIFIVCQYYIAPDKIDPKFFSYKSVFADVTNETNNQKLNLINPAKTTRKREGYADDVSTSMYREVTARTFFNSKDHLDILSTVSTIVIKEKSIDDNTSNEIKETIKDIKVLGKREIKNILKWREKFIKEEENSLEQPEMIEEIVEDGETTIENQIMELQAAVHTENKQKKKRQSKLKEKNMIKIAKGLDLPKEIHGADDDPNLFNLRSIVTNTALRTVEMSAIAHEELDDEELEGDDLDEEEVDEEELEEEELDEDDENRDCADDEEQDNPLIIKEKKEKIDKTKMWFSKLYTELVDEDVEEDLEVDAMAANFGVKSGEKNKESAKKVTFDLEEEEKIKEEESSDSDTSEEEEEGNYRLNREEEKRGEEKSGEDKKEDKKRKLDHNIEVVPITKKQKALTAAELALGHQLVTSRKRRNEIMDEAYHRWSFGVEEDLPEWFQNDEKKYYQKSLPVTKEQVEEYKQQVKEINARPIKKIAEAKARSRFKAMKKLKKISAQADAITDNSMGDQPEQVHKLKQMMKKAGLAQKKPETTYVVARRRNGQHQKRPPGAKGRVKFVDGRMRKDTDGLKRAELKKKGKGSGKSKPPKIRNRVGHKPRSR